jgi:hypothetical protein
MDGRTLKMVSAIDEPGGVVAVGGERLWTANPRGSGGARPGHVAGLSVTQESLHLHISVGAVVWRATTSRWEPA